MNPRRVLALSALFLGASFAPTAQAVEFYLWTGIGNGWKNQTPPPNDGSAALAFADAVRHRVPFSANFTADSLHFFGDEEFEFFADSPLTLTVNNGINASESFFTRIDFSPNLTVNIAQPQTWTFGMEGGVSIRGPLAGAGDLTIFGDFAALILNNQTTTASTHSGKITLTPSGSSGSSAPPTLAIWGTNSVGTGQITFTNGGTLVTHGAPTLSNPFVFGTGPLQAGQTAPDPIRFRVWDGPATTLAGAVTLGNNTTLQVITGWVNKRDSQVANNTGSLPLPGPLTRNPLVISGGIGDNGSGYALHVTGSGVLVLAGTNTYSGGTFVGHPYGSQNNAGGSVVFASASSVPATGLVIAGALNTENAAGYAGLAVSGATASGTFQNFITNTIHGNSSGAVGLDTLPGETTQTFTEAINLSGFTTSATHGIRLGTATSATLTGSIWPQRIGTYHFGNGGGRLVVQSSLGDIDGPAGLVLSNQGTPLELHLQGTNTYTGGTTVANGILVFDHAVSLPSSGSLRAGGAANFVGQSYIGIHAATEMTAGTFLARFDAANTWGTVGFDGGMTVQNLNLTGFNDGVYVGTASAATLAGTITPTSVTNTGNSSNTVRLTAAAGGTLTVDALIADTPNLQSAGTLPVSVTIGVPVSNSMAKMSDGTVVLTAANTYTGGTAIHGSGGIRVTAGNNSAFGSGPITLKAAGGPIGLSAGTTGISLNNPIVFESSMQGGTPTLFLGGPNNFTLSGNISGPSPDSMSGLGSIEVADAVEVTFSGDNSGFHGSFGVWDGKLHFNSNTATGRAGVFFAGLNGVITFNAPNPVLYGLEGEAGTVVLPDATVLTINVDNHNADYDFGGVITGAAGPTTASLVVTGTDLPEHDTEFVYLYGQNQYTGGTTVTGSAALGLGHSSSAGTGPITIDAINGGVAINSNVTLTNPINLLKGGLAGFGTFAPTAVNGTTGAPLTIGANHVLLPGLPGENLLLGKLTLGLNTVFQNGGTYHWLLHDPNDSEGYSLLHITGTLDLTALTAGGFLIAPETVDAEGHDGTSTDKLVFGQSYSLAIISTTLGVTGFDAADFSLDVSRFQQRQIPLENFSLTADANTIYLNFTAVPEPSTWALMASGAALLGLGWLRRHRRARAA